MSPCGIHQTGSNHGTCPVAISSGARHDVHVPVFSGGRSLPERGRSVTVSNCPCLLMACSYTLNGTEGVVEVPSNPLEQKRLQSISILPYVADLTSCQVFVASSNS